MGKRFLIIANPIAGGGRGRVSAPLLRDALAARGCTAEVYFTEKGGDGRARAASIRPGDYFGVVSVGGDGTLNEVLNGLPDPEIPLGMLAMGTANVLAAELGLPRRPEALAAVLVDARTQVAAIGVIDGRRFLLFVSSGLDAQIVQRVSEVRTGRQGKLRYIPPILHVLRRWPVTRLAFTTGDGITHKGLSTVIVTRVKNYAAVLTLPGDIDVGDGLLHVIGLRQSSRWQYARACLRGIFGRLRIGKDVIHVATDAVQIHGEATPWQVDGEFGGTGPVEVTLDPRRARLFVP